MRANVHTNTIEGVWPLFKRPALGSYHHLSGKHLPAYLDEMTFGFNNRDNPYLFGDTIMALIGANVLEYKQLTAKS